MSSIDAFTLVRRRRPPGRHLPQSRMVNAQPRDCPSPRRRILAHRLGCGPAAKVRTSVGQLFATLRGAVAAVAKKLTGAERRSGEPIRASALLALVGRRVPARSVPRSPPRTRAEPANRWSIHPARWPGAGDPRASGHLDQDRHAHTAAAGAGHGAPRAAL